MHLSSQNVNFCELQTPVYWLGFFIISTGKTPFSKRSEGKGSLICLMELYKVKLPSIVSLRDKFILIFHHINHCYEEQKVTCTRMFFLFKLGWHRAEKGFILFFYLYNYPQLFLVPLLLLGIF